MGVFIWRHLEGKYMRGQTLLVWGMGRSGLSSVEYALSLGAQVIAVDKTRPAQFDTVVFQSERLQFVEQSELLTQQKLCEKVDLIILSPGIARELPELAPFHQRGIPVVNEIELAHQRWREHAMGPVVAITGSNGKTTTTTMVAELLSMYGKKVFAGGNLGIPFVEVFNKNLEADIAVLELSSFQLESLETFQAEVRVLLNLTFTHGERYSSMDDYAKAKFRLDQNLSAQDLLITPSRGHCPQVDEWLSGMDHSRTLALPSFAAINEQLNELYDMSAFKLPGEHNLANLWVTLEIAKALGFENQEVNQRFINEFSGVKHRLQVLRKSIDQLILNDAKSTNWDATLTALATAVKEARPLTLILGGQTRGHNDAITPYWPRMKNTIDHLLLIGHSREQLYSEIQRLGSGNVTLEVFETLKEAVEFYCKQVKKGTLLFSPAFPSFDQYLNYEQRGADFIHWVEKYQGSDD